MTLLSHLPTLTNPRVKAVKHKGRPRNDLQPSTLTLFSHCLQST